jgi:carbohydrate-binding DOMON domain-containing protein
MYLNTKQVIQWMHTYKHTHTHTHTHSLTHSHTRTHTLTHTHTHTYTHTGDSVDAEPRRSLRICPTPEQQVGVGWPRS